MKSWIKRLPSSDEKGRLTRIARGTSAVDYRYDRFGRLTQDGELSYAYDANGNPTSLVYPGGVTAVELQKAPQGFSLHKDSATLHFTRLAAVPERLQLRPVALGVPAPLSKEKADEIGSSLLSRGKADQQALKGPAEARNKILQENHDYLLRLLAEHGWIDIDRFGKYPSSAALLIAKHSGDLALIMSVLPIAEKDARAHNARGEMISVLYDENCLLLGQKQRYGAQIIDDAEGHGVVLPVEDRSKVDEYRKQLGIPTWAEYLRLGLDR